VVRAPRGGFVVHALRQDSRAPAVDRGRDRSTARISLPWRAEQARPAVSLRRREAVSGGDANFWGRVSSARHPATSGRG
jgi:hypothetical protein